MGSFSNYAEDRALEHLTTNAAYTPVATAYLALATADPTDAATGAAMNEVANTGSYARTAITFGAAASRRVTQSGAVIFPEATGNWTGPITHWSIVDSGTYGAGNVLASGQFATSFSVVTGNTRTIPTTEIYVEFSASVGGVGLTDYFANGFLNRMFRNQAFTISNTFLSLHITTNSDSTPGTEVSGTGYTRKEVNENGGASPAWTTVSGGAVSNGAAANFPTPGGSWGNVKSVGIYDAATVGNQLAYGNDVVDQDVGTETTQIGFPTGDIDIILT